MPAKKSAEPWEKPAPKKNKHTKLTPASKAKAEAAAKKAGRKYPSLVDNMNAAKKQRAAAGKKSSSKKGSAKGADESKPRSKAKTSRAKKS
jgi:hypothetical protein